MFLSEFPKEAPLEYFHRYYLFPEYPLGLFRNLALSSADWRCLHSSYLTIVIRSFAIRYQLVYSDGVFGTEIRFFLGRVIPQGITVDVVRHQNEYQHNGKQHGEHPLVRQK